MINVNYFLSRGQTNLEAFLSNFFKIYIKKQDPQSFTMISVIGFGFQFFLIQQLGIITELVYKQ